MSEKPDRKALLLAKKTELQQKQAKLQAKIDRFNDAEKKLANGRKILWGAALLDEAEKDPKFAAWALKKAHEYFSRQVDKDRIAPDVARFTEMLELAAAPTNSNRVSRPQAQEHVSHKKDPSNEDFL